MKTSTLRSIGVVVSAHGLQGEVSIKPWDEDAAWVGHLKKVYLFQKEIPEEMTIMSARVQGGTVIVKFKGVNTREAAEALKGATLKAMESSLPELGEDEFYADAIAGMAVVSEDSGQPLGTVREVLGSDAGDFLEVTADNLSEPVLVPFQNEFVPRVDTTARTLYLSGLDSLFED